MPEGPSIVILKELLSPLRLEGKAVKAVAGNTTIAKERMLDQRVTALRSWGKHFLICFEDFTLRVHFMLFGSYRINERKGSPERLRLTFEDAELNLYTCSLQFIEDPVDQVYDWSADVMSADWDPGSAARKLEAHPGMFVCDALLDQQLFAGVGNIIKNEVLYRIRVHPLTPVGSLPPQQLLDLLAEARNYSFDFLRWKKEFTLKKHWLAHHKKTCLRCKLLFHKDLLGKTRRRSYYCENCQILYGIAAQ